VFIVVQERQRIELLFGFCSGKNILMGEDDNGGVVMGDEDDKEYILQHFPP